MFRQMFIARLVVCTAVILLPSGCTRDSGPGRIVYASDRVVTRAVCDRDTGNLIYQTYTYFGAGLAVVRDGCDHTDQPDS